MGAIPPDASSQRDSETQRMGVVDLDRTLALPAAHGFEAGVDAAGLTEERGLRVGTRQHLRKLAIADAIAAKSELTEEDIEELDQLVKQGIAEAYEPG